MIHTLVRDGHDIARVLDMPMALAYELARRTVVIKRHELADLTDMFARAINGALSKSGSEALDRTLKVMRKE